MLALWVDLFCLAEVTRWVYELFDSCTIALVFSFIFTFSEAVKASRDCFKFCTNASRLSDELEIVFMVEGINRSNVLYRECSGTECLKI